jgi:hypothetical protein
MDVAPGRVMRPSIVGAAAQHSSLYEFWPRKKAWVLIGGTPYPLAKLRNFRPAANPLASYERTRRNRSANTTLHRSCSRLQTGGAEPSRQADAAQRRHCRTAAKGRITPADSRVARDWSELIRSSKQSRRRRAAVLVSTAATPITFPTRQPASSKSMRAGASFNLSARKAELDEKMEASKRNRTGD